MSTQTPNSTETLRIPILCDHIEMSDKALVSRAKSGDKRAFDELCRRHSPKVRSIVNNFVTEPADAEDLSQETFLCAYKGLQNFRGDSQFYSWLYRIAFNRCINFYKSRVGIEDYAIDTETQSSAGNPESLAIVEEDQRKMVDIIDRMPDIIRQTLLLNTYRGYDYKTVSLLVDCPIGTVRSRLSRARGEIAVAMGV